MRPASSRRLNTRGSLWLALLVVPCGLAWGKAYCPLPWNADAALPQGLNTSAPCPYGQRIPLFDVTVPNGTEALSVNGVCVFWGLVPFMVVAFMVLTAVINAFRCRNGRPVGLGTREVTFLLFVLINVGLNELIFKRIAKQPRPTESCNFTCGFPSGHSVMAIGFFTLISFDSIWRTFPRLPMSVHNAQSYLEEVENASGDCLDKPWLFGLTYRQLLLGVHGYSLMPLSNAKALDRYGLMTIIVTWGLLLLPVPMSRLVLRDHTALQVMFGSLIGFSEGAFFFALLRHHVMPRMNHLLGKRVAFLFIHDYPLPVPDVVSRAYVLLAEVANGSAREALLQEVVNVRHELTWYYQETEPTKAWFSYEKATADRERELIASLREELAQPICRADSASLSVLTMYSSSSSECDSE